TKASLVDAMTEKAEATSSHIDSSMGELDRQVSWTTRASADRLGLRRNDYTQLLSDISAITQITWVDGQGHELLSMSRTRGVVTNGNTDYSRDPRFNDAVAQRASLSPA